MQIIYVPATPELQRQMKEQSSSNASDFIHFEDNFYSVIAVDDSNPIALIVAKKRPLSKPVDMLQEAYIDVIEVHPDYQRRGIGAELVKRVLLWAKENELSQIRAWSEEIRYAALMLWKKLGFTFSQVNFQRGDEERYGFYVTKQMST
jgi:GNAT superfamily N-acetyltransferase